MQQDDAKNALVARRIAELEAELHKFSILLSNLQESPDSSGHRYAAERIESIVAEIETLKTPPVEDQPVKDAPPLHSVLFVIGAILTVYGFAQQAWGAVVLGVAVAVAAQVVKTKATAATDDRL
ncbi:hypothetical protein OS965_34615 [Streptomyces sp. H27-G5]|uniref:hypothetical protein n=1 Tax=Streptomyces sp. H27-G5 TaxID=2996698 RepID=UPI002271B086|nr:hypothetical protein [Streptomyces sp. H27-G5]MCY0923213.1 hypothetical protein [Streptomyces sp. H27-G5]